MTQAMRLNSALNDTRAMNERNPASGEIYPIMENELRYKGVSQLLRSLHYDVNLSLNIRESIMSHVRKLDDALYFLGHGGVFHESEDRALANFGADDQNIHTGVVNRKIMDTIGRAEMLVKG